MSLGCCFRTDIDTAKAKKAKKAGRMKKTSGKDDESAPHMLLAAIKQHKPAKAPRGNSTRCSQRETHTALHMRYTPYACLLQLIGCFINFDEETPRESHCT